MGISIYKVRKWVKMLTGNSISHVNQGIGKVYSVGKVEGYYNDLTEKVTKREELGDRVPISSVDTGETLYFSIEIFQYGLGAYDMYLLTKESRYLQKVKAAAEWGILNQREDGSWVTFSYENPAHPYSSMAQGEGISLLIRSYLALGDERYLTAVKKALEFMLKPLEEGGTTKYAGDDIYFYECTEDPLILNGWIFSLWGVMDYSKLFPEVGVSDLLNRTLKSLEKRLPDFDLGYWSKYEDGKRICSPFYHKLHVAQLNAMYELTGREIYKEYAVKWDGYQKRRINVIKAFIVKATQKVFE